MVTIDGDVVDWIGHVEADTKNYALMDFNSSNSGLDTEVISCSKVCEESYAKLKKLYDEQKEQLGDASIEIQAHTLALKKAFNSFIVNAGLVEVPLGGCSFTWCHKSAKKMSKLDFFLISDNLMCSCPSTSSTSLDRFLSDHLPIIMRDAHYDYGPIPFKFFRYWFKLDGFDKKSILKAELADLDGVIDKVEGSDTDGHRRRDVVGLIQEAEKVDVMEVAQKAKIKWSIEGDENSKYYHGVLNKKRGRLTIRGVLIMTKMRRKRVPKLSAPEKLQYEADVKATNIILQGLPANVYEFMSRHRVAKDLWEQIELLMQGTSLTKQERQCKLYDAFDKFTYIKRETLSLYYCIFAQLINDMHYQMRL
nr:RNA-directed DNA polymerase, eukaryota, reverse transcriptase zinc-binding domain protein [Tanacetum cinerariifolium]